MSGLVGNSQRHVLSCRGSNVFILVLNCLLEKGLEFLKVRHKHSNDLGKKERKTTCKLKFDYTVRILKYWDR